MNKQKTYTLLYNLFMDVNNITHHAVPLLENAAYDMNSENSFGCVMLCAIIHQKEYI